MNTRALVLAGGGRTGLRWRCPPMPVPRHMVEVGGEPLVHRTTRMLAGHGVEDILVFADPGDVEYVIPPAVHEFPRPTDRGWVQEWEPSRHAWNNGGRTVILYGDCYFTEELLRAMVEDPTETWNVYGRKGESSHTGKKYGEMFGWVIEPQAHALLTACQREAIRWKELGLWNRALGWEVYRISQAHYPWDHYTGDHFVEWDDASEDFDVPSDYAVWAERTGLARGAGDG